MRQPLMALTLVVALASPASAGQPISKSMAQCAGIAYFMLDLIETQYRRERVQFIAETWHAAANREAGREMAPVVEETRADWHARGKFVVFSEDYKDWTAYCGSLARHKGLNFDGDT